MSGMRIGARGVAVRLGVVLVCVVSLGLVGVACASAQEAWWGLSSSLRPAHLAPGQEGVLVLTAIDLGDVAVNPSVTPVTITDTLPAGLEATGVETGFAGSVAGYSARRGEPSCPAVFPAGSVTCTWNGTGPELKEVFGTAGPEVLQPFELIEIRMTVRAQVGAVSGENEVAVSGGESYECERVAPGSGRYTTPFCRAASEGAGAFEGVPAGAVPAASLRRPLAVEAGGVSFGVEDFRVTAEEEGGTVDTRAGSHPFQLTTRLALDQTADLGSPPAQVKDLGIELPAGLVGNATAAAQCTEAQFLTVDYGNSSDGCPADTAVGVVSVDAELGREGGGLRVLTVPVFNLVPAQGEPARFGYYLIRVPILLDTYVRTGEDYGVTVTGHDVSQAVNLLSQWLTLWGVPSDPRHDLARGWECVEAGESDDEKRCGASSAPAPSSSSRS
jgi:hypothetical protein